MPREQINWPRVGKETPDGETVVMDAILASVCWDKMVPNIQVSLTLSTDRLEQIVADSRKYGLEETSINSDPLDRYGTNLAVRTLRKARDQSMGADA